MGVDHITNIEDEIWKDIEGFPGYQVSNQGRVRSFRDFHGNITDSYRILKPLIDKNATKGHDYYYVDLYTIDRKSVKKRIHRLVAENFLGRHDDLVVNHKNGDKHNNHVYNLEWVTSEENSRLAATDGLYQTKSVRILETNEIFKSIKECADALEVCPSTISHHLAGREENVKGLHIAYISQYNNAGHINKKPFLYDFQMDAVNRMFNGCILAGGTGSGKSRTGLYYYFKEHDGSIIDGKYTPMKSPRDLYIITTAKKRNDGEWIGELAYYLMSPLEGKNELYNNKIVVDSWNNIQKYTDTINAFFIFDEDKVQGNGSWVKSFLKIAKSNKWIILSATSGDVWMDYVPVFIANGFYKNRSEFCREHVVYSRFAKYPKIERYINTGRLLKLRSKLLIDMDFERKTVQNREDIYVDYNPTKYREVIRTRWDPYKNEPIEQAAGLCYVLRRIVNEDESRQVALLELFEKHPKMIVFYSYDYEREILLKLAYGNDVIVAQYNGHVHDKIPDSNKWVYLVNYNACEGWNCITTDTIVFYSQTYSYKTLLQAEGRIYRLNTPFKNLYYYHLKSRSGIDLAISKALREKKNFNEGKWAKFNI